MEDNRDYEEFSVEPYVYWPELRDCRSDLSESDSDSEVSCVDAQDDHSVGYTIL